MIYSFRHSPEALVLTGPKKMWRAFRSQTTAFVFSSELHSQCDVHRIDIPSKFPFTALRTIFCRKKQEPETRAKTGGRCVAMCTSSRNLECPLQIDARALQSNALETAQGLYPNDLAFPTSWFE